MKKLMYMTLHIPCVLLLVLHEYLWVHSDDISLFWSRLVRDIKGFITQVAKFVLYLAVATPLMFIIMVITIKLS